jgi:CBS domain-containing protein
MTVGRVCTREVVVAYRHEPLREAARLMRERHTGTVVVVDVVGGSRMPVGIVTDRDIAVAVFAADCDAQKLLVGDVTMDALLTVREDADILDVVAQMRDHGVRRVPVVDSRGVLVGIVSADDLLDVLAEELSGLARIGERAVTREQRREVA